MIQGIAKVNRVEGKTDKTVYVAVTLAATDAEEEKGIHGSRAILSMVLTHEEAGRVAIGDEFKIFVAKRETVTVFRCRECPFATKSSNMADAHQRNHEGHTCAFFAEDTPLVDEREP